MSDKEQEAPSQEDQAPDVVDNTEKDHMVPIGRLNQVLEKNKELEAKFAKLEASQKAEEEKRLAAQNEWQALAEKRQAEIESLSTYKTQWEDLESEMEEENKKRIEALPEDKRTLVPAGYSPTQLSQWLNTNAAILGETPKRSPGLDGGAGGRPGSKSLGSQTTRDDIKNKKLRTGVYRP